MIPYVLACLAVCAASAVGWSAATVLDWVRDLFAPHPGKRVKPRGWHHGLTQEELAEEFPEDLPRAAGPATPPRGTYAQAYGGGPGRPWEPPTLPAYAAAVTEWRPRICAGRIARLAWTPLELTA